MADFADVACPQCHQVFMVGEEFFRLPEAYCHCPYCATEFRVGVAAGQPPEHPPAQGPVIGRGPAS
jgi:hypothetical protein